MKLERSKLVYAAAFPLATYLVLTTIGVITEWGNFDSTQAFAIAKHLVTVFVIAVSLLFYPRVGSLVALAWCVFVPFERYGMLFQNITSVVFGAGWSMATIVVIRIVLLLTACLLSGVLAYIIHLRKPIPNG